MKLIINTEKMSAKFKRQDSDVDMEPNELFMDMSVLLAESISHIADVSFDEYKTKRKYVHMMFDTVLESLEELNSGESTKADKLVDTIFYHDTNDDNQ